MKKTIKITKKTIDNEIINSLFDFCGYTDDPKTALQKIIARLENEKINYTLSAYARKIASL